MQTRSLHLELSIVSLHKAALQNGGGGVYSFIQAHSLLQAQISLNLLRLPVRDTKGYTLQGYAWEVLRGGTMAKTRSPTRISVLYLPCS